MPNSDPWLILDCNYLCYRAFYTTGQLTWHGDATGVAYGFLKEVKNLMELFGFSRVVFAWDHGRPLRAKLFPGYKQTTQRTKTRTIEERQALEGMQTQVHRLKFEWLPRIGFRNVIFKKGYEADDVIAEACKQLWKKPKIIVSADKDLYQCLDQDTRLWNPQKKVFYGVYDFEQEFFGISPREWRKVKAIAGCATDNVPGIKGVGEKSVAKYLADKLPESSAMYAKIQDCETSQLDKNFPLVKLPWPGLGPLKLREGEVSLAAWKRVVSELGMVTLAGKR